MAELDEDKRSILLKEASIYLMENVISVPTNCPPEAVYWWPWLKNYYGESSAHDYSDFVPFLATAWLDLDLKAEMGY